MPSVNANRFMSSLAVIPMLHALWVLSGSQRISARSAAILVLQALLFSFAVSIRKTAQLQLILVVVPTALILWRIWRTEPGMISRGMLRRAVASPVAGLVLFLSTYGTYNAVQNTQLNDLYFSECALPHHLTWHSIYMALSLHPDWELYNTMSQPGSRGDTISWTAFEKYMKERNLPYTCSQTGGLHKVRTHEHVLRQIYVEFAVRNPIYMLELHSYYKPVRFIRQAGRILSGVTPGFWVMVVILSIFAGMVSAMDGWRATAFGRNLLAVAATGLFVSVLPAFIAYPTPIMSDMLWMVVVNLCLWVWYISYRLLLAIRIFCKLGHVTPPPPASHAAKKKPYASMRCLGRFFLWTITLSCLPALGFMAGYQVSSIRAGAGQTIDVTSATYGKNCGAAEGNASMMVRDDCRGKTVCKYKVDVAILGDPANGCSKDFEVNWTCTNDGTPRTAHLKGEAGLGSIAKISCGNASAPEPSTPQPHEKKKKK